jgi:hypothetical protein
MTHQESPWLKARQGVLKDTRSSAVIAIRDMHDHFSRRRNVWEKGIPKPKAL